LNERGIGNGGSSGTKRRNQRAAPVQRCRDALSIANGFVDQIGETATAAEADPDCQAIVMAGASRLSLRPDQTVDTGRSAAILSGMPERLGLAARSLDRTTGGARPHILRPECMKRHDVAIGDRQ